MEVILLVLLYKYWFNGRWIAARYVPHREEKINGSTLNHLRGLRVMNFERTYSWHIQQGSSQNVTRSTRYRLCLEHRASAIVRK